MSEYYFDHAASAPRRDEVADAMAPWMHGVVGNPSGSHRAARVARKAVEDARDIVAQLTGTAPGNVVFTAGGTEACTLGVAGAVRAYQRNHGRAVVVHAPTEHHAVLDTVAMLTAQLPDTTADAVAVDGDGIVDLDDVARALRSDHVALVTIMAANNETGVLAPIDAIATMTKAAGVLSHSDVVAAALWTDLATLAPDIDMLSLCGHKIGGPVNAGALILRSNVAVDALAPGGGQEKGRRGGTVDVAACVGLATALSLAASERTAVNARVIGFRDELAQALSHLDGCEVTAASARRTPGTVHLTFRGIASDELLFLLDQAGLYASAAASCSSGAVVSSHVLAAMGIAPERARGSLRLSMGAETTRADVEAAIAIITAAHQRLRGVSATGELAD